MIASFDHPHRARREIPAGCGSIGLKAETHAAASTHTSFIIIDNKGRLPASGKGAWHPELHVDANSLSLSLLSVMGEYFNSFSYFHLFAGHR